MRVVIVEDEELAVRKLKRLLEEVRPDAEVIADLDSVEATVDWLATNESPDIILMDIELVDGQSFEIFEKTKVPCPVIFITSYDEYAIQAFTVNSVSYLLKPVEKEDLMAALDKYEQIKEFYSTQAPGFSIHNLVEELQIRLKPKSFKQRFLVKYGNKLSTVDTSSIAYFFAEERFTFFKTYDNKKMLVDYTLEELQQQLDPSEFFMVNRSYLVAIKAIQKIDDYFGQRLILQLKPEADEQVIISRGKVTPFKNWMGK